MDVEALADALVAKADRPEVAQLLRPDLPDMLRAMLVGAKVPGSFGMGERSALFRMAGLPVERSKAEGDSDKARLNDVAGRLERAIGMQARLVEAHVTRPSGQESVTAEGGAQPEPPESLRFDA